MWKNSDKEFKGVIMTSDHTARYGGRERIWVRPKP